MMFLQALPTQDWGEKEMEILLSEAYVLTSLKLVAMSDIDNGSAFFGRVCSIIQVHICDSIQRRTLSCRMLIYSTYVVRQGNLLQQEETQYIQQILRRPRIQSHYM
jgi:hypothetical protein